MLGAGLLRGRDGCQMLMQALARLVERIGGDDQDAVGAGKGPVERGRIVEVGDTCLHALADIVGKLCRIAAGGDDVGRLDLAGCKQRIEHELAELAGGAGHEQCIGHELFLFSVMPADASGGKARLPVVGLFLRVALI